MCAHIPAPTQASETDLDPLGVLHAKLKSFQQNQLLHNFLSQKQSMQQNQCTQLGNQHQNNHAQTYNKGIGFGLGNIHAFAVYHGLIY